MHRSIVKKAPRMSDPHDAPPVNPLPPVVLLLFAAIVLPELAFTFGAQGWVGGPEAVGWRLAAIERYGFSGDIFDWMIETGRWMPEHLVRFVSYALVHESFTSALFGAVLLLALGKLVGETMGQGGAFPAAYALIGGYTFLMWQRLADSGQQQLRAFSLIAILLGIQLLFGVFFGPTVQWVADLAGFVFGFCASVLMVPGGLARVVRHLRRD